MSFCCTVGCQSRCFTILLSLCLPSQCSVSGTHCLPLACVSSPLLSCCLTSLQGIAELRAFAESSYAQQAPTREQHLLGSLLELIKRQPVQKKLKPLSLDLALLEAEPEVDSEVRIPLAW